MGGGNLDIRYALQRGRRRLRRCVTLYGGEFPLLTYGDECDGFTANVEVFNELLYFLCL